MLRAAQTAPPKTVGGEAEGAQPWIGRRRAALAQVDLATPTQLTIDKTDEELTATQVRLWSIQAFEKGMMVRVLLAARPAEQNLGHARVITGATGMS